MQNKLNVNYSELELSLTCYMNTSLAGLLAGSAKLQRKTKRTNQGVESTRTSVEKGGYMREKEREKGVRRGGR